jgi:hypothetical protein
MEFGPGAPTRWTRHKTAGQAGTLECWSRVGKFQRGCVMDVHGVLESCWEIPRVTGDLFDFDRRVPRPSSRHPSTRLRTPSPAIRPTGRPVVASRRTSWEARPGVCAVATGAGTGCAFTFEMTRALGPMPPEATELCMAVEQPDATEWSMAVEHPEATEKSSANPEPDTTLVGSATPTPSPTPPLEPP